MSSILCRFSEAHYSRRSATTGSNAVARRLATSADKNVAAVTDSAELRRTCVAVGDTPYSMLASSRQTKSEPITPNDTPINEKVSVSRRNINKMLDGHAPTAIRTPISGVREFTE